MTLVDDAKIAETQPQRRMVLIIVPQDKPSIASRTCSVTD